MGNYFAKLKANFNEANSLLRSNEFYQAAKINIGFCTKDRLHRIRKNKNIILVYGISPDGNEIYIGSIKPSNLEKAINIAKYILDISSLKLNTLYEDDLCPICLERPQEIFLFCGHGYCEIDIDDWNNRSHTCPMCRDSLRPEKMFTTVSSSKSDIEVEQSLNELFSLFKD